MIDLPNIPSYSLQYPMIVSHCMGYIEIVLYMGFFDDSVISLICHLQLYLPLWFIHQSMVHIP